MRFRPYSSLVLALGGVLLMSLGTYFFFLRPPLLPEDPRYMGTTSAEIQSTLPGLLLWLRRVFWVTLAPALARSASAGVGGYMFASGLLTVYLALTSFRARARGAAVAVALSGLASIGWMVVVNFIINSDFKWLLLAFALVLYAMEKGKS